MTGQFRCSLGLLAICWLVLLLPSLAVAQSEPTEPFTPENLLSPLPEVLSEGTLQPKARLWFSDRNGNMVLAPEEFAEDYFSSRGKSASAGTSGGFASAVLEKAELDITVQGDVAEVVGRFSTLLTNDYAASIALSLASVQWNHWVFSGPNKQNRLQPSREEPGWRWIVQSPADVPSSATLRGVMRVNHELGRRQLILKLPTAPCIVHVQLPNNAVDVRVRSEDVLQRETIEGRVQYTVTSAGGEFLMSWQDQEQVAQVAAVHATSNTKFEIVDPAQPWQATTTLNVRWHGRDATDKIRIVLPAGGRWRATPSFDFERYRISSDSAADSSPNAALGAGADNKLGIEAESSAAAGGDELNPSDEAATPAANEDSAAESREPAVLELERRPLLLENFDVVSNDTIEVVLEWEWTPETQTSESLETTVHVAVPQLTGVDQHLGTVDCIVTSAYAVVYQEGAGAQLIHQGPLQDAFARQQLQFKFDRQPFDLSLLFRREQSLPTVRPTYLVHVDRNKLTLTMWFDCSFDTNRPQMELGLVLDEWVVQENTARVVPSSDDLFSSTGETLRVQQQVDRNYIIRSAKGDTSAFGASRHVDQIWRVVAERTWNTDEKELYFQIPQIIRGQINGSPEVDHGSGALLVTSDSNVLLNWQESVGTGLQRDSFSTEYRRYVPVPGVRKPLVYRFQSSATTPRWAGRAELLARQISVEQHVNLEVAATQVSVRQDFDLQIANEPLGELRFAVRKDVADNRPPQLLVNGLLYSAPLVATIDEQSLLEILSPARPLPRTENEHSQTANDQTANDQTASEQSAGDQSASGEQSSGQPTGGVLDAGQPRAAQLATVANAENAAVENTAVERIAGQQVVVGADTAGETSTELEHPPRPLQATQSDTTAGAPSSDASRSDASQGALMPEASTAKARATESAPAASSNPAANTGATLAEGSQGRAEPSETAGSGILWNIYQVLGNPELIGPTQVTLQTSTPWKGDAPRTPLAQPSAIDAGAKQTSSSNTRPSPPNNQTPNNQAPNNQTPSDSLAATDVAVPLAQLLLPNNTTRLRHDWSVRTELQVDALLRSDAAEASDTWLAGQRVRPLAENQRVIELQVLPRRLQGLGPVRIDKCWLQSFVGGSKRRERFVVHVASSADELRLKLPREAIIREGRVKVSVNGFAELLFNYDQQTDVITIPLSGGSAAKHVVEVSYYLPDELGWATALSVAPPEILGAEQIDQFYWQLLTPAVQHLAWSPGSLTAEWTWQWSGLWWNRVSRLNQRQLESWIGAVVQESPPASANSYVMSGRGMEGGVRVWVLSRFILWLPIGLLAISISFVALNYAFVRRPVVVLMLAAGIAGLTAVWPDMAVLAGQTAVISLGLVALVWIVQAGVDSRVRRRSVFSARPSTYIERSELVSASRSARTAPNLPQASQIGSSVGHRGG